MTASVVWLAVGRSMRWSPLIGAPVAAIALVLIARVVAGADAAGLGVVVSTAQVLVGVSLAFVADDDIARTAPGVPTSARARLAIRLVLGTAAVACGWCVLFAVQDAVTAEAPAFVSARALDYGAAGLAVGVYIARRALAPSPGAVAAVIVVALSTISVVPERWQAALPDATAVMLSTMACAAAVMWLATREPIP